MEREKRKIEDSSDHPSNDLRKIIDDAKEPKELGRQYILKDKSYRFVLRIVNVYKFLFTNFRFLLKKHLKLKYELVFWPTTSIS